MTRGKAGLGLGGVDSQIGATYYTYPTPLQQLGEADDPIYLFFRDNNLATDQWVCYSKSTDGGATWSAQTEVFQNGTLSAYWKVTGNGDTRIDIVTSDSRTPPDAVTTKMYAFYYDNGTWRRSNGAAISGAMPYDPADLTLVYDGADGTGWPMDVVLGDDGKPRCSFAVVTGASSNDWRYARWTGSAWTTATIAASGGVIEGTFASSVVLDHADPNVAYAPIKVGSRWELYAFRTDDGGATWSSVPITSASAADHATPVCIRDHPEDMAVLVMYGTYTDYSTFATGIRGAR
jgi:hypothetical protein